MQMQETSIASAAVGAILHWLGIGVRAFSLLLPLFAGFAFLTTSVVVM